MDTQERCAHYWDRAISRALKEQSQPVMAKSSASITRTVIFTRSNISVTAGQLLRVPSTGGQPLPINLGYRSYECVINLPTAIKEAVGNTLKFAVFRAIDNQFISGYPGPPGPLWTSYGGPLVITYPDHTTVTDPDPAIVLSTGNPMVVNPNTGQAYDIYVTVASSWSGLIGVTVSGLK